MQRILLHVFYTTTLLPTLRTHSGIATFPDGIPLPLNITRQVYGYGTRAGMTPVSPTQLYWFTCFNANEVRYSCFVCCMCCTMYS